MAVQPFGSFVPTTQAWELDNQDLTTENMRGLLVRLYQQINLIALVLNTKDTGIYPLQEFINGQQWFANPAYDSSTTTTPTQRPDFRIVVPYYDALPAGAGMATFPHNLAVKSGWTFTRIYGVANDVTNKSYLPLPYASPTLENNIELSVNATDVIITTGSNRSTYTVTYVVLEYLKG